MLSKISHEKEYVLYILFMANSKKFKLDYGDRKQMCSCSRMEVGGRRK